MRSLVFASVFLAAATGARSQAPDGFRTHDDPAIGVSFYYPAGYQEIPLEPTETATRVKYVRRGKPPEAKKGDRRPPIAPDVAWFEVFVIAKAAQQKPAAAAGNPFLPKGLADDEPASRPAENPNAPKNLREMMLEAHRIHGFEEFKQKKLGGFDLSPIGLAQGDYREWKLRRKGAKPPEKPKPGEPEPRPSVFGYCGVKEDGELLLGVFGVATEGEPKDFESTIRRTAKSLRLVDGAYAEENLERLYKDSKLRDVARRVEVRKGLARGWKAIDTENFIVIHHTPNERLVSKTARDIEAIRPFYVKHFPPAKPVEAVAIVRLCRDMTEYMSYGAPPGSGGFFHPGNEELVLYDYKQTELAKERTTGRRLTDKDSLIVLYHEAFHQYIHYAVGEIAPHDWFNEGHGDYFSGAVVSDSGKVMKIGSSPWRVTHAKAMAEGKAPGWVPAEKLVRAPRAEYYNPAVVGNYYAAGWAFVYFLREAPEVAKNPAWNRILGAYFETLKAEYAKGLGALGPNASLAKKQEAGGVAREAALKAAFDGVDFAALEAAWRAYVAKLTP
jgi:hypothetical protein